MAVSNEELAIRENFSAPLAGEVACKAVGGSRSFRVKLTQCVNFRMGNRESARLHAAKDKD